MILSPMIIVPDYAESNQNMLPHVVACGNRQVPFIQTMNAHPVHDRRNMHANTTVLYRWRLFYPIVA